MALQHAVLTVAEMYRADALTIESTGNAEKHRAMLEILDPYGVKEIVKSGMVAIGRGGRSITDRGGRH